MKPQPTRGIIPALTLFVLTPLVAEYLLGSLSIAQLGALPILCFLYGSAAVLIRESARTRKRGWPTVVILGTAYAIIEEGLATQSLFNPHYLHLRLLDYGYIPFLGMGASWTVYVLVLHVIWSICVPIAIVEALFPAVGETPWLGVKGWSVFGVLLLAGILGVTGYTRRTEQFFATPYQLVASGFLALLLIFVALRRGGKEMVAFTETKRAPTPWAVGAFAFVAGSAFELVQAFQAHGFSWEVGVLSRVALVILAIGQIGRWSARDGWSAVHRAALGVGGLLVYCWWGFSVEVSLHGKGGLVAHTILVMLAVGLGAVASVRAARAER